MRDRGETANSTSTFEKTRGPHNGKKIRGRVKMREGASEDSAELLVAWWKRRF